jgi:hypothetical protein
MTDLSDAVEDMVGDLLEINGANFSYIRNGVTTTVSLSMQRQPSFQVPNGIGGYIEVTPIDFVGLTSSLPYDPPLSGDRLVASGQTYEICPTVSEKVYRRLSSGMTRLHTKQVAAR